MTILNHLDHMINTYYAKKKEYPKYIVLNSITKKKVIELYKLDLHIDFIDNDIIKNEDNYRGIFFKIDEKETFVKCI